MNILVGTISVAVPTSVAVGVTSGEAVAMNTNRAGLILVNISAGTIYLGLGGMAATLNAGIVLLPNGGSWSMDEYTYNNEQVNAVAHFALSNLAIQEFIR